LRRTETSLDRFRPGRRCPCNGGPCRTLSDFLGAWCEPPCTYKNVCRVGYHHRSKLRGLTQWIYSVHGAMPTMGRKTSEEKPHIALEVQLASHHFCMQWTQYGGHSACHLFTLRSKLNGVQASCIQYFRAILVSSMS
jgi:hypothetical protein